MSCMGRMDHFPWIVKPLDRLLMLMEFSRCDSSNHEVLSLCAPPEVRLVAMTLGRNFWPASTCIPTNNNWPRLGGQNVPSLTLAQATCSNLHLAEEPEGRECSPACICAPGAAILAHNSTSLLSLYIVINQIVICQSVLQGESETTQGDVFCPPGGF